VYRNIFIYIFFKLYIILQFHINIVLWEYILLCLKHWLSIHNASNDILPVFKMPSSIRSRMVKHTDNTKYEYDAACNKIMRTIGKIMRILLMKLFWRETCHFMSKRYIIALAFVFSLSHSLTHLLLRMCIVARANCIIHALTNRFFPITAFKLLYDMILTDMHALLLYLCIRSNSKPFCCSL